MADEIEVMRVAAIGEVNVSADPDLHHGIACLIELIFSDGAVRLALPTAAYRKLVDCLVLQPPPAAKTRGLN